VYWISCGFVFKPDTTLIFKKKNVFSFQQQLGGPVFASQKTQPSSVVQEKMSLPLMKLRNDSLLREWHIMHKCTVWEKYSVFLML